MSYIPTSSGTCPPSVAGRSSRRITASRARASFIADWTESWENWELEVVELIDAGEDRVLAILHQRGRSKTTGLEVEMDFAQLWTVRDGKQVRMEMYADPQQGREAAGLDG